MEVHRTKDEVWPMGDMTIDLPATSEPPRRSRLKNYDLLPHHVLNSMGAGGVETVSLDRLAAVMSKGNEAVKFFSELCDESLKRKGVAIICLAEIQLKVGKKLRSKVYKGTLTKPCTTLLWLSSETWSQVSMC